MRQGVLIYDHDTVGWIFGLIWMIIMEGFIAEQVWRYL